MTYTKHLALVVVAAVAITQLVRALPPPGTCRCVYPAPCWAAVPWDALNASVNGRLVAKQDELQACLVNITSPTCQTELTETDDEFWLSSQPFGYLHNGLFGVWNITSNLPAYAVAAETEADIQAAVNFARQYNLRLVIKGTGHDWYGRSAAPSSLMIWTHLRNNITFNASWVAAGSNAAPVAAVTVQTGVQFRELYAAAAQAGRFAIGGTCDSVGVGGCWFAGCYGTFSRLYGSAASNLLEARVVLANGSLVVANAVSHPDLFYSLRGGAAGLGGVVTEFTARTHAPPRWVVYASVTFTTDNFTAFTELMKPVLTHIKTLVLNASWSGYLGFWRQRVGGGYQVSVTDKGFEGSIAVGQSMMQPMLDWVATQPPGVIHQSPANVSSSWTTWESGSGQPVPWMEQHPDREISTSLAASMSRYPMLSSLETPDGLQLMAEAFANLTQQMPDVPGFPFGVDIEKGQGGASPLAVQLYNETSQNPVNLGSIGLFLIMVNIPDLPELPPSAALLASQWSRISKYVFNDASNPLYSVCEGGARGNESLAIECYSTLKSKTIPAIQAQLAAMNETLRNVWPYEDEHGVPVSGSYWNEADYLEPNFQLAHWGRQKYTELLAIKNAYDPEGLFVCHHCVGSESWSADGNCVV